MIVGNPQGTLDEQLRPLQHYYCIDELYIIALFFKVPSKWGNGLCGEIFKTAEMFCSFAKIVTIILTMVVPNHDRD
jgi:hypothetical protein